MATVFTITGADWGWTEEARVPEPQINLKIFPAAIPTRENVPGNSKVGPTAPSTGWEVRVFDALTEQLIAYVPKWRHLSFQKMLSELGAGGVEMDSADPIFLNIATNVMNRDAVWAIYWDGLNVFSFHSEDIAENPVTEDGIKPVTFSGRQVGRELEDGVALPTGYVEGGLGWTKLERTWLAEHAMKAFLDLLTEAQARGAVLGITPSFTATADSRSNPYPIGDKTDINVEPGESMFATLKKAAEIAGADWLVTPSGELQVGVPLGDDLTTVVQFQVAHDQMDFTRNHTRTDLKNVVYVEAGAAQIGDSKDTGSIGTWGRREHYMKSSEALSRSAASLFAARIKATMRVPQGEVTLSVLPDHVNRKVFFDYDVGDWVGVTSNDTRVASPVANPQYADGVSTNASPIFTSQSANFVTTDVGKTITGTNIPNGTTILTVTNSTTITMSANATASGSGLTFGISGRRAGYRVRGIGISVDDSNTTLVELTCESLLMHNLAKMKKAIESGGGAGSFTSTSGGTNLGGTLTPGQTVAAASLQAPVPPPTNLFVQADSGLDGVWVDVSWDAPVEPDSTTDPVQEYEVEVVPTGLEEKKTVVRTRETSIRISGLFPNQAYIVYVYAITRLGRVSAFLGGPGVGGGDFATQGDTSIPPNLTTAPLMYVAMRSATVTWVESTAPDVKNGNGQYIVEIDDNTMFNNASGRYQSKATSGTIITFSNLIPPPLPVPITDPLVTVTYYARVKPVDSSGNTAVGWSPTSTGAVHFRIDQVDIGKNTILAPFIVAGQINTDHIAATGIDAGHIKFGTMNGDLATIINIDAQYIKTSSITASTITIKGTGSLLIGTGLAEGPHNYAKFNANELSFWSGGTAPFSGGTARLRYVTTGIDEGKLFIAGDITSTATITGGILQGALIQAGSYAGLGPKIVLDSLGLRAYSAAGGVITNIEASGTFAGRLTSTDIVGTSITCPNTFGSRISLISPPATPGTGSLAALEMYSNRAGETLPGSLYAVNTGTYAATVMRSPKLSDTEPTVAQNPAAAPGQTSLLLYNSSSVDNGFNVIARGGDMDFSANFTLSTNVNGQVFRMESDRIYLRTEKVEFYNAAWANTHAFFSDGEYQCNSIGVGGDNNYNAGIKSNNGWIRVHPSYGYYFEVSGGRGGGGIYMQDTTWVRTDWDGKWLYNAHHIQSGGSLQCGTTFYCGGDYNMPSGGTLGGYVTVQPGTSPALISHRHDHGAWDLCPIRTQSGGGGTGASVGHHAQGQGWAGVWKYWPNQFEARNGGDTGFIAVATSSSRRFKKNVRTLADTVHGRGLRGKGGKARRLRPVAFDWIEENHCTHCWEEIDPDCRFCDGTGILKPLAHMVKNAETPYPGLIAEEVAEVFPEVIRWDNIDRDGDLLDMENITPLGFDTNAMLAVVLQAWQETDAQTDELADKIERIWEFLSGMFPTFGEPEVAT